jgi:integrase
MLYPTYLFRRGDTFYYRAKVPTDLKNQLKRGEIWISLRTSDRHKAALRLAETHAQQLRTYDCLRQGLPAPTWGNFVTKTALEPLKTAAQASIDDLLRYWVKQTQRRPRTLMDANTAVRRLKIVVGELPPAQIDKRKAVAFKDSLIQEGLAYATASKNLGLIKSMFEIARSNELIHQNPFKEVKLVKPTRMEKARVSFTSEEIEKIFSSPVFKVGLRPKGGAGEAAVWLPLIAYMTGMRLEEIGQLTKDDVKRQEDIWFFNLDHAPNKGRVLKNESSRRQIPVHSRLIELGFLDLVSGSTGRLFPDLSSAGARQLTASWSQWFGRYLRQVIGIADRRKTFHSFRHTFKDLCREAGISKDLHDRLTGHTSQDVGDGYGAGMYPLRPLAVAIDQIQIKTQAKVHFTL